MPLYNETKMILPPITPGTSQYSLCFAKKGANARLMFYKIHNKDKGVEENYQKVLTGREDYAGSCYRRRIGLVT